MPESVPMLSANESKDDDDQEDDFEKKNLDLPVASQMAAMKGPLLNNGILFENHHLCRLVQQQQQQQLTKPVLP